MHPTKNELADMPDGCIDLDTPRGVVFGFISKDFDGYLWKKGDVVSISFIESRRTGAFCQLVHRILSAGLTVVIPTPLARMEEIVRKNGYVQSWVYCEEMDADVELWTLTPEMAATHSHPDAEKFQHHN